MQKPKHYKVQIEPITYILENRLGFLEGSIIKRLTRYQEKDGLHDLYKAKYEIEMLIKDKENKKDLCKKNKSERSRRIT
jgi:hypothetical protein